MMLVEFEDVRDKARVIRDGPWSFDKQLVMVNEVDGTQQVNQILLTEALYVEEVELEKCEMAWGEFMRV